jgi:hypothetical protein
MIRISEQIIFKLDILIWILLIVIQFDYLYLNKLYCILHS